MKRKNRSKFGYVFFLLSFACYFFQDTLISGFAFLCYDKLMAASVMSSSMSCARKNKCNHGEKC